MPYSAYQHINYEEYLRTTQVDLFIPLNKKKSLRLEFKRIRKLNTK